MSFFMNGIFFFGKLTYVLKEEDTNIIRGIPQIYNITNIIIFFMNGIYKP